MPIYEYACPYGHKSEHLRRVEDRHVGVLCPKCNAPADLIISAPHVEPDGVYSYEPNIGTPANYERKHELHRRQMEERAEIRETGKRKRLET